MRKIFLILSGALMMLAGACTKDAPYVQKEKSTDLVVPGDFKWKTTDDLTVNITGLPLSVDFFTMLTISGQDGSTYFSGYYNMKENLSMKLVVPSTVTELILTCGKRTLKQAVENGVANFTFFQADSKSDLVN